MADEGTDPARGPSVRRVQDVLAGATRVDERRVAGLRP